MTKILHRRIGDLKHPTLFAGFSLIEMLVVLAILAILVTLAMPSRIGQVAGKQIQEGITLASNYHSLVTQYQRLAGEFPKDNEAASMPEPDKIIGHYVSSITVDNGVLNITYGKKAAEVLQGKVVSIQPLVVKDSPNSPISWVCGEDEIPDGMEAVGINRTNVPMALLPLSCK